MAQKGLQIHLLGNFHLILDGETVPGLDSSRLQSFLAYLLLHPQSPIQRQQLAYTFWPDSSDSQARTNLRNTLFKLREAFPAVEDYLEISNQTLWWHPEVPIALDLAAFMEAADHTNITGAGRDPAAHRQALEAAVEAYPGDLLPNCYEDWISPQREGLRHTYLQLLEELAETLHLAEEHEEALPYAQALVRQDPLLESAYQLLMSIYLSLGDKARALQTYHQCADTLEKELGLEPNQQTFQLYQQLLARQQQAPGLIRITEKSARLVGRDEAWTALQEAWQSHTDQPHLALIQGEAGIGKTYLAESFLRWARREGIHVLKTRSYPTAGELAYTPVTDLLRSKTICPKLSTLEEPWLVELSRLLPEIQNSHPDLPQPQPMDDSWQRQRLFEAAVRAILKGEQRLVILMDDLQWCDRETLAWLGYLLKSESLTRLLILGTVRSEDLGSRDRLGKLIGELGRMGKITTLELSPLSQESTQILARDTWGDDLDPETAQRLYRETEGNPLFVVEIVRSGFLQAQPGDPRILPPKVQSVIETRLNTLTDDSRELARIAAVYGREFNYDLLIKAAGVSEEQAVESLDELWGRRVIRDEGEGGYNFSHDKFREVIYGTLSPPKRGYYHKKIALALEELAADQPERAAPRLAFHFYQAGEWDKAVDYYLLAGNQARALYAGEDAIDHYQHAAALLGSGGDPRAIQVYRGWGNALLKLACYTEAGEAYQKMVAAAGAAEESRWEALAWLAQGKVQDRLGQHQTALECAEKALAICQDHDCQEEKAEAVLLIGQSYHRLGQEEKAEEQIIQALEQSVKNKDPLTTGRCLSTLGLIKDDLGEYQQAQDYKEQALEIFQSLESSLAQEWVGTINNNLANTANLQGDYQRAVDLYEEALKVFRLTKNQDMIIMCQVNQSAARVGLGEFSQAQQDLQEVLALKDDSWLGLSLTYYFLAEACLGQGKVEEAKQAGLAALARAQETGAQQALGAAWRALGRTASLLAGTIDLDGESFSAQECFQRSAAIFEKVNAEAERAHTLKAWAEHEQAYGDQDQGQQLALEAQGLFEKLDLQP